MKLGISSWTYTWAVGVPGHPPEHPMTALDLLNRGAELGVHLLQVADNLPLDQLSPAELDAFEKRAAELDISIEVGMRGIAPDHLRTYLRLDVARFLFGEAESLYCQTHRVHADIKGEDVATVMMKMGRGTTVVCEISYASRTEHERFPETYIFVEGDQGSLELGPDFWIRATAEDGTHAKRYPPPRYAWADPAYDVVHSSIVPCNADLLRALKGEGEAETTGEDNLKTVRLVFAAYESAASGRVIQFD